MLKSVVVKGGILTSVWSHRMRV